jgi:caa(3)-type oxidase subunit IV
MAHTAPHNSNDHTVMYETNQEMLYHGESHGTKEIWQIFGWLTFITILDIILYFAMTQESVLMIRNIIFIIFGIVKAYLIVGYFMHMKHEKQGLALSIIVPMVFVIGLILGLLYEGDFWSSFN